MLPAPNLLELLLIGVFATYRLTLLLVDEAGPFDVFERLRYMAGVRMDEWNQPKATNQFAEGLICFYCCSVWVGFGVTGLLVLSIAVNYVGVAVALLLPFSLSGGAVYLRKAGG